MATMLDEDVMLAYLGLVRAFPLISIRNEEQWREALEIVSGLMSKPDLSTAEEAYLSALADLIETFENTRVHIPPISGLDALRYLMEENGLAQADLVPEFGTASIVSEVLSGKRRLSLRHIQRLAARFGLPADVFMDAPTGPTRAHHSHSGETAHQLIITFTEDAGKANGSESDFASIFGSLQEPLEFSTFAQMFEEFMRRKREALER
ncbi:MAG TPA: hypothetical protein VGR57_02415 [Ktedonobacterales bacterium]|nr:hypothetical protein [Ktedonobacterales bacterium]